jgi:hypothetical protein
VILREELQFMSLTILTLRKGGKFALRLGCNGFCEGVGEDFLLELLELVCAFLQGLLSAIHCSIIIMG